MRFVIYRDADKLCAGVSCLLFVLLSELVAAETHYVGRSMPGMDQTQRLGPASVRQSSITQNVFSIPQLTGWHLFSCNIHLLDETQASISRRCHLQIPPYGPQSDMTFSWLLQHYIICYSLASDSLLRPLHIIKWHEVTHHLISKLFQLVVYSPALNSYRPLAFSFLF